MPLPLVKGGREGLTRASRKGQRSYLPFTLGKTAFFKQLTTRSASILIPLSGYEDEIPGLRSILSRESPIQQPYMGLRKAEIKGQCRGSVHKSI